jgi:hypothetical protein
LAANDYLTVRVIETAEYAFKWATPVREWQCVKVITDNYGDFATGFRQWVFQAHNTDTDCEEVVELTRHDGTGTDIVTVKVKKGFCPALVNECEAGYIQNIDVNAENACECEPLHPAEERLIDFAAVPHPGFAFAFNKGDKFTLREWALTTGVYEWNIPAATSVDINCMKSLAEPFDDGRYRQVSYEALTPDCRMELTLTSVADETVT